MREGLAPMPPAPPVDPTFLVNQVMPLLVLMVVFVGIRWVFRSPVGEALAERIRSRVQRRGGSAGEDASRVAGLEGQLSPPQGEGPSVAQRLECAERAAPRPRGRRVGRKEHAEGAVQVHETGVKPGEETEKLKLSLRQLNDRIEDAKRRKNILIARQKRAEAHKRIQETMSSIGDKGVFETFERMSEQIEHEERRVSAAGERSRRSCADPV